MHDALSSVLVLVMRLVEFSNVFSLGCNVPVVSFDENYQEVLGDNAHHVASHVEHREHVTVTFKNFANACHRYDTFYDSGFSVIICHA